MDVVGGQECGGAGHADFVCGVGDRCVCVGCLCCDLFDGACELYVSEDLSAVRVVGYVEGGKPE